MKVKKQGWIHIAKYLPDGPHLTERLTEFWKPKVPGEYIATIKVEWEEEI